MSLFLDLKEVSNKQEMLRDFCSDISSYKADNFFISSFSNFKYVPTTPFCYWAKNYLLELFKSMLPVEGDSFDVRVGIQTSDDFRFVRSSWEVSEDWIGWFPYAKGGSYSPFYSDLELVVNWCDDGREMKAWAGSLYNKSHWTRILKNTQYCLRPGVTWSQRSQIGLGMRVMPRGCVFGVKGPAIFSASNSGQSLLALMAIGQSRIFKSLVSLHMAFGSFDVGVVQRTPIPPEADLVNSDLPDLALKAWNLKRKLDYIVETSHAFVLPRALLEQKINFDPVEIVNELGSVVEKIELEALEVYSTNSNKDFLIAANSNPQKLRIEYDNSWDEYGLLSWCVGVAMGRFDIGLATGTSLLPDMKGVDPFEELSFNPARLECLGSESSPVQEGIFVEGFQYKNDLTDSIEGVLKKIEFESDLNVKEWLVKDFFSFHLKQYSRNRRQAPIYWPLQSPSKSYTLWIYYQRLDHQTLYTCVNNFIEPKLAQVEKDLNVLSGKSPRNSQEEKEFSALTELTSDLRDFRDELLRIAKFWKPNLNDGVQITAAPLWKLFQDKAWQKKLKETWVSLEKGEFDWAPLACSIWPERVLRKCHQDRSLAIAHNVEDTFWNEVEVPVKRGKKETGKTKLEWQPKALSDGELNALIQAKIKEMNA
jgi:hypothetical protein